MHKIQHKDWKTRNCDYLLKNRKTVRKDCETSDRRPSVVRSVNNVMIDDTFNICLFGKLLTVISAVYLMHFFEIFMMTNIYIHHSQMII